MKLPAAAGPSTRFPMTVGAFVTDVTGGFVSASGEAPADLVDASGLSDFALTDGADAVAGDSARGPEVWDADRAGTV